MASIFKRILVGKPLASSEQDHQALGKLTALAVFASDAISSTAKPSEHRGHLGALPRRPSAGQAVHPVMNPSPGLGPILERGPS